MVGDPPMLRRRSAEMSGELWVAGVLHRPRGTVLCSGSLVVDLGETGVFVGVAARRRLVPLRFMTHGWTVTTVPAE